MPFKRMISFLTSTLLILKPKRGLGTLQMLIRWWSFWKIILFNSSHLLNLTSIWDINLSDQALSILKLNSEQTLRCFMTAKDMPWSITLIISKMQELKGQRSEVQIWEHLKGITFYQINCPLLWWTCLPEIQTNCKWSKCLPWDLPWVAPWYWWLWSSRSPKRILRKWVLFDKNIHRS